MVRLKKNILTPTHKVCSIDDVDTRKLFYVLDRTGIKAVQQALRKKGYVNISQKHLSSILLTASTTTRQLMEDVIFESIRWIKANPRPKKEIRLSRELYRILRKEAA